MIRELNFFPQTIGYFRYEGNLSLLLKRIYQIQSKVPNFNYQYPKETLYQTPFNLFEVYPEFSSLSNFILENIEDYFDLDLEYINSWINIYHKYGYSAFHTHTPAFCSGVFYISTTPETHLGIHNKHEPHMIQDIPVNDGDILFFDGDQPHSTMPHVNDKDKVCIAFNLRKL